MRDSEAVHRATMRPYTIRGKTYYPTVVNVGERFDGIASWYGPNFHGKHTSNGEIYDMYQKTAAHKTLPMNTMVRVTNKNNGRSVVVRINDRGPFVGTRIIDLSRASAQQIQMIGAGTAPVEIEILGFSGVIATLADKTKSQQSVTLSDFAVQIGSFRFLEGATRFAKQHSRVDGRYSSGIKSFELDGEKYHRVYLTGFGSEEEARDFIEQGKFIGAYVVRE